MDLLAHLEAFVAVGTEASFSRAADRLGIAQPLLSRRVKTLEEHFGGQLFDRSRRQVTTTELGLLLLPYASDVLERAQRLQHVARSARRSAIRVVGVPADSDPAALARVIRVGADHDKTMGVHEMAPDGRVAGLADGSLAYALVRVPPEQAALVVPLGLASGPPPESGGPGAGAGQWPSRHVVYLEDLRPRRGHTASRHRRTVIPIRTTAEDEIPSTRDRLRRAAARAGLPERLVCPSGSLATALAETLAGRAMLLCTEQFARRSGADWAPLGDQSLHRGYHVCAAHSRRHDVPGWLVASLAAAVGAALTSPARAPYRATGEEARTRLGARG